MKTGDKSMLKGAVLSMEAGMLLATDGRKEEAALEYGMHRLDLKYL